MNLGLAGRVAIVTGASRGIGRAVAEQLAAEGAHLVIAARTAGPLAHLAAELSAAGATVVAQVADVVDGAQVRALADRALQEFGRIDVVVNNAGGESGNQRIHEVEDTAWEHIYRLNVVSAVQLSVAALPSMRARQWGRIVNVASYTARVPEPFCAPYAAAKAALVNVSRNFARSYSAEGILTNCVLPGLTRTDGVVEGFAEVSAETGRTEADLFAAMTRRAPIDMKRMGEPAEVAAAIVFLCSEPASWITGAAVNVDGGTVRTA